MVMCMVKSPNWPADRFRDLMERILSETGLPQAQLAALVPMDQSQLSRWKSGSSKPKFESLQALGEALQAQYPELGIGPDDLTASVYPSGEQPQSPDEPSPSEHSEDAEEDDSPISPYIKGLLERVDQRLAEVNEQLAEQSRQIKELRREQGSDGEDQRRMGA